MTSHRLALTLACLALCFASCDGASSPSPSSMPTISTATNANVVGTWVLHPDSAADASYNYAAGIFARNGIAASESQIRKEARSGDASTMVAAAGTLTLNTDRTAEAKSFDTRTGTWTLNAGIVSVTFAGDPEMRRMRYAGGDVLIMLPRIKNGREVMWRRK